MLNERIMGMICSQLHLVLVSQIEVVDGEHNRANIMSCLLEFMCERRYLGKSTVRRQQLRLLIKSGSSKAKAKIDPYIGRPMLCQNQILCQATDQV